MKFIDFFAGVGGFRRGLEMAGHECVGFCEWDKFATASYTAMHLATPDQLAFLETLPKSKRVKEILKSEYRNGEWYSNDVRSVNGGNCPEADCYCFGAPCQDFSTAGDRAGLDGNRSSLVAEIFRIVGEQKDKPEWLIYENVTGMFTSNSGWDYFAIISEMDRIGYDVEWQVFNSKYFGVPQNRERVYTIGHFRNYGRKKILPIIGTNGCDSFGESPGMTLIDKNKCGQVRTVANTITAREDRGVSNQKRTGPAIIVNEPHIIDAIYKSREPRIYKNECPTLRSAQCNNLIAAVWYEPQKKYVSMRKLTPRECFRFQGWSDEYFDRAALINSDAQLYKQAGNGVTVNVVYEIGKRLAEIERGNI